MKRVLICINILFLSVCLCTLPHCAKQVQVEEYARDGEEYGVVRGAFRHRWWNYFERASNFVEGRFYEEAIKDLKIAITKRYEDQRRARTYGMHFKDYFPHRELGVIYFLTNNLNEAKKELELSISQFPSAKAHFYLDQVRQALLKMEGRKADPPSLTLDIQEKEIWTRDDIITISGLAQDENYISGISINRIPVFLEGSQKRVPFKQELSLPQGTHDIDITATNLLEGTSSTSIVFHVDRQGPVIALEELKIESTPAGRSVLVKGSLFDEGGLAELKLNNRSLPLVSGQEAHFQKTFTTDKDELEIVALDRLGNQTLALIPLTEEAGTKDRTGTRPIRLASASPRLNDLIMAQLRGGRDSTPPSIRLRGWGKSQTVFLEKVYLDGEVRDDNEIRSLTINQQPILRHRGSILFFNHLLDLQEGPNEILIEAIDRAGNVGVERIVITREIPRALQLAERLSLTIIPFEQKGEISTTALAFQDNLINSLVNRNRFNVIEREKLDVILSEQKLSRTSLIDQETALTLGRLAAARCVMIGSIVESRQGIEIVSRLIDTETSKILSTQDVYDQVKDLTALRSLADGLALKVHRDFPLLDGYIVQHQGKQIFTDLGQDKIKLQQRLIVYSEEPVKHPETGKVLGTNNIIHGRARVNQVMPQMSRAEFLGKDLVGIKTMDRVITE